MSPELLLELTNLAGFLEEENDPNSSLIREFVRLVTDGDIKTVEEVGDWLAARDWLGW